MSAACPKSWERPRPRALHELLRAHDLSLAQLVKAAKVTDYAVSRWVRGLACPTLSQQRRADAWLALNGIDPAAAWAAIEVPMPEPTDLNEVRAARGLPTIHPPEEPPMPLITSREYLEPEELDHFGLNDDPMDDPQDPTMIWMGPGQQRLERSFWMAVKRRRIVVITADPGAGKSTLIRRWYAQGEGQVKAARFLTLASLDRAKVSSTGVAVAILRDLLGRDTSTMPQERRSELLRETLADQDRSGKLPVLLVEEAHLLGDRALIALKQVWDSHTLFHQLSVCLVGQTPLKNRLRNDPAVRELAGRAQLLEVPALGADVAPYLRWRFARVGADADQLFSPDAYKALATRGEHALWVNNLTVLALRYAASLGLRQVKAEHIGRIG